MKEEDLLNSSEQKKKYGYRTGLATWRAKYARDVPDGIEGVLLMITTLTMSHAGRKVAWAIARLSAWKCYWDKLNIIQSRCSLPRSMPNSKRERTSAERQICVYGRNEVE
jgi:hypothetical protein